MIVGFWFIDGLSVNYEMKKLVDTVVGLESKLNDIYPKLSRQPLKIKLKNNL